MQDSVLPQGVGLRKPHILFFLLTPSFTLLTPPFPSLTSDSFPLPPYLSLLTSHFSLLSPFFKGGGVWVNGEGKGVIWEEKRVGGEGIFSVRGEKRVKKGHFRLLFFSFP